MQKFLRHFLLPLIILSTAPSIGFAQPGTGAAAHEPVAAAAATAATVPTPTCCSRFLACILCCFRTTERVAEATVTLAPVVTGVAGIVADAAGHRDTGDDIRRVGGQIVGVADGVDNIAESLTGVTTGVTAVVTRPGARPEDIAGGVLDVVAHGAADITTHVGGVAAVVGDEHTAGAAGRVAAIITDVHVDVVSVFDGALQPPPATVPPSATTVAAGEIELRLAAGTQ